MNFIAWTEGTQKNFLTKGRTISIYSSLNKIFLRVYMHNCIYIWSLFLFLFLIYLIASHALMNNISKFNFHQFFKILSFLFSIGTLSNTVMAFHFHHILLSQKATLLSCKTVLCLFSIIVHEWPKESNIFRRVFDQVTLKRPIVWQVQDVKGLKE